MDLELTILGSSSAIPLSNRFPTSQFLTIANRHFLIDCGEGTQMQLRKNKIGFGRINHILISHLHGDHIFGLLPLLTSLHLLDRQREVHIYGPRELEDSLEELMRLSGTRLRFPVIHHQLEGSGRTLVFEDDALRIFSFPLKHSMPCWGFIFSEKDKPRNMRKDILSKYSIPVPEIRRIKQGSDWTDDDGNTILNTDLTTAPRKPYSYAFCTDTLPLDELPELLGMNPTLLYHEATFTEEHKRRAKQTKHSTAKQAAEMARKTGAANLLIGHFSVRYDDLNELLDEAREVFPNTQLATENSTFVLKSGKKLLNKSAI